MTSKPPSPLLSILCALWTDDSTQGQLVNLFNSQNEHRVSLRAHANQEGDAMTRAFEQSHAAYARKDGAGSKELLNEGRAHQREIECLNAEASAWIFRGEYSVPFKKNLCAHATRRCRP